mmetsp:Transcript_19430/g.23318  ORF Transcript_19430/g.23318 Transcript_19430/m.23318 type:complete len:196 (-) Transcript_19430:219-806(-)|eukprot:CAMPEP_0195264156 /NCGR_PEP_ID=MMETSP0706-20130129/10699_1 /TAXON_ID=33640 /ORGANISM="Asterionellopsis glacialis, Strain CCMP134" /LENGTH=195 /DNA_ID=CAMNT_0040318407 /DNA_START=53 /DNA_END=640 /DNA_ORIENTATION=-
MMTNTMLFFSMLLAVSTSVLAFKSTFQPRSHLLPSQRVSSQNGGVRVFGIIQDEIEEWEDNGPSSISNNSNKKSKEENKPAASTPTPEASTSNDDDDGTDWDAEWQKVVKNQGQPAERPGKDFYKSEAEIAAMKATRKIQRVQAEIPKPSMNWNSLKNDPKFWIAVIAAVSIGSALIGGAGISSPDSYTGDSYYV